MQLLVSEAARLRTDDEEPPGHMRQQPPRTEPHVSFMLHEVLAVAFALVSLFYCFLVLLCYGQDKRRGERLQATATRMRRLRQSCDQYTSDITATLNALSESAAQTAERSFEARRRSLIKFTQQLREQPEHLPLQLSRELLVSWMEVFAETSLDAKGAAVGVLARQDAERVANTDQLADLVAERLERMKVTSISLGLEGFAGTLSQYGIKRTLWSVSRSPEHKQNTGSYFPLCVTLWQAKLQLLTPQHAFVWCACVAGLCLLILESAAGNTWVAVPLCFADLALLLILSQFQDMERLRVLLGDAEALRLDREAVHSTRTEVEAFRRDVRRATGLWTHRTLPILDLLEQTRDAAWKLLGLGDGHRSEICAAVLSLLSSLNTARNDSFGDLESWYLVPGEDADALPLCSREQLATKLATFCEALQGCSTQGQPDTAAGFIEELSKRMEAIQIG